MLDHNKIYFDIIDIKQIFLCTHNNDVNISEDLFVYFQTFTTVCHYQFLEILNKIYSIPVL